MFEEKLAQAHQLIRRKQYEQARRVLQGVDHPTARQWLARIDQIVPPLPAAAPMENVIVSLSADSPPVPPPSSAKVPPMTPAIKQQMQAARDLINKGRYDEACAILASLNHPTAIQWLNTLNEKLAAGIEPASLLRQGASAEGENQATRELPEGWGKTQGQVTSIDIEHGWSGDSETYLPRVEYTYQVMGRKFRNNQVTRIEIWTSSHREVQKVVDQYSIGQSVDVYYNLDNPQMAHLIDNSKRFIRIALLIAVAITIQLILAALFLSYVGHN